jgi:hypothetical protein
MSFPECRDSIAPKHGEKTGFVWVGWLSPEGRAGLWSMGLRIDDSVNIGEIWNRAFHSV